ncbi:uncharacterized protein LOC128195547 [Vigna angularis]|uniref:uncharacterized protein LOC128195547 n=1 Tax=Phaseolus angularis TaxID=3914 RepID=UPI0022B49225|nr:uncharacterized protein LOC128195547 [Vigna angularis]
MGYRNVKDLWYSLDCGPVLEDCLEPLLDDKGACHLINIAMLNGEAHLYVAHRVCEPEYLLQLEYFSEPQINRPSGEGQVERECGDLQVDRPSGEGEVQRESTEKQVEIEVGEADVEAVGETEVETVAPEVEPESEVEPEMIEVEVDVVADVEAMVEVQTEAMIDVQPEVEPESEVALEMIEVEVDVVADVEDVVELQSELVEDVGVEAQVEVQHDGVEAQVEAESDSNAEGNMAVGVNVDGQSDVEGQAEEEGEVEGNGVEADEYDVRSWNGSEEDVLIDHGDEVGFDIFEATNEVEFGGPRGLSDSDWESESLNSVVESDNTDDDKDGYGDFGVFSIPKTMEQYKWEVGTYFNDKKDFTEAIRSYGVENGRKLKVYKNDKRRVRVRSCGAKGKCPWNAYCAYKAAENTWQLRKIVDNHTCSREFNIRLMTSKWLSGRLEKTIK